MKSFCILEVFILFSVVELEAASEFLCPERNLTVTADDLLRLYVDGIEITNLTNSGIYNQADVVDLPCTTRLIAIHGRNGHQVQVAGILASTGGNFVLTNSTWKCSNISHSGWEEIDFDDSAWMSAVEMGLNGEWNNDIVPGISPNASWIWLRQWNGLKNSTYEEMDMDVYCRKRLDINECLLGASDNECDPSMGECVDFFGGYNCSCSEGYTNDGSKRCKDVDECLLGAPDNECDPSLGVCMNVVGGYNCSCYEGYTNDGSKRCKDVNECLLGASDNECDPMMGECVNFFGGYNCSCNQGYTNDGSKRCRVCDCCCYEGSTNDGSKCCKASTDSCSTSSIILGVLFVVSVLANLALIAALLVLHLRKKTGKDERKDEGKDEGQSGVDSQTNETPGDGQNAAEGHQDQNYETLCTRQTDSYETLQTK